MNLEDIRNSIDSIDLQIKELFLQRMQCSSLVAKIKSESGKAIYDEKREKEIVKKLTDGLTKDDAENVEALYNKIFEISRNRQSVFMKECNDNVNYGLCGRTLKHSYSAEIHASLGNAEYKLISLEKDAFYAFMCSRNFKAVNVTIPYKKDAYELCDVLDESAKNAGSVNTVVNRNGTLYGYNTDVGGFIYMADKAGIILENKNVVILGSGGTSLTAREVCRIKNAKKVTVVSRDGEYNYDNIAMLSDTDVLINTTPVGMYPDNAGVPVDINVFPNLSGVIDVIYNPYETKLVSEAKAKGIKATTGLPMLVRQAVLAHEHFFDIKCDDGITERVLSAIMTRNMNVVLVGMPGCGKSTVGKLLSQKYGKEFIDTDTEIEKNGLTIPDMFEKYGEDYFRSVEAHEVAKAAKMSCCVIATGGGAVKRECNIRSIRQNSVVVYIKRDIENLCTSGRPLSNGGRERLEELYRERHEKYEKCADFTVDLKEDSKKCAEKISDFIENIDYYSFRRI